MLVLVVMMLGSTMLTQAQDEEPPKIKLAQDVPYLDDGDPRHVLDFYAPIDAENFPVLMFVSGGGWSQGSKEWVSQVGGILAEQGIGVVLIDHRLMPYVSPREQVEDLAAAFAWVMDRYEAVGADPSRIFVGGHSAGGHLMSLVAMDGSYLEALGHSRDEIAGVVLVSGAIDMEAQFGADLAPLNFVDEDLPPFLIAVSAGEGLGILKASGTLQSDLEAADVPVEFIEVPDTDHYTVIMDMGLLDEIAEWINTFPIDEE
jgi:acetyl esterase/lipase